MAFEPYSRRNLNRDVSL